MCGSKSSQLLLTWNSLSKIFSLIYHSSSYPQTPLTLSSTELPTGVFKFQSLSVFSSKMEGYKDPAIKLFGKTIKLVSDSIGLNLASTDIDSDNIFSDQNTLCSKQTKNRGEQKSSKSEEDRSSNSVVIEECKALGSLLNRTKNPKSELSKKEDQSDQTSSSESQDQNTPKKPDKILPCPRCNSMNTKFCYFNNYNVNQPRHFCKSCQRYWTAGGTIRNVPVGAGRRKNKSSSSASHHRTLVVPNGLTPHPGLVLAFGPDNISPPLSHDSNCVIPIPWGSRIPVPLYATSTANWTPPALNWQCVTDSRSLGKHARDESERSVVIPKTLRIDDPNEAAKSSIWGTLGIKNEKVGCSPNGFFEGFKQFKKGIIDHNHMRMSNPSVIEGSHMFLQSNPAAFSRSITFHESAHPTC